VAIIYKEESYAILGACIEVYKGMGGGFLEPVYELEHERIVRWFVRVFRVFRGL
jgi:hypothetical protein